MSSGELPGPYLLRPSERRNGELLHALFLAQGFRETRLVDELPTRGVVVALEDGAAAEWAEQAPGRLAVLERTGTGAIAYRLGQRVTAPARAPGDKRAPGDAYLRDVVELGLYGLDARLAHGRPFPAEWAAYAVATLDRLAERTDDPRPLRERAARLRCLAASAELVPVGGDRLLEAAASVASGANGRAWDELLAHLDFARGLFRRERGREDGWQLHPVVLLAVATRIDRYRPPLTAPVTYPSPTSDDVAVEEVSAAVWRLDGPLLSDAARVLDPPSLPYAYDFSEYSPEPALDEVVLDRLPCPRTEAPLVVAVRHDVDRPLDVRTVDEHLALERRLSLASSWYFKQETLDEGVVERLLDARCEVGYHAEHLETGDEGFARRLTAMLGAAPGVTYHGGLGAEGWRGGRSLSAAARAHAAYAEFPVAVRSRPVLWPTNGTLLPLTPLPVKVDVYPDRTGEHVRYLNAHGGLAIVENHPDRWSDGYVELLEELSRRAAARVTVRAGLTLLLSN